MMRVMLKSKISYATVTETNLFYKGSITIDAKIMQAADLLEGEKVEVLNLNNGSRIETYCIGANEGSGIICLNGPAARAGFKGDFLFILAYGLFDAEEIKRHKVRFVELDEQNRIKHTHLAR